MSFFGSDNKSSGFGVFSSGGGDYNPNKDVEVPQPPSDGISSLAWSKRANFLVAGSWDCKVRCWEVRRSGYNVSTQPKAAISHEAPVLCTTWSEDGTKVFSGGCDNKAHCWDLNTGSPIQAGQHQAPIKVCFWVKDLNALMTGSWDKTIKYWDGRTSNPALDVQLPERCYCADVMPPLCVVGTAERHVLIYDVRKPNQPYKTLQSPLKYQTRCIACFPDQTGFAIGSIEGRVGIQHVEDKDKRKNFAFKCHRENNNIYAINAIDFQKTYGTFATCGSDGGFHFWDMHSKQRLKAFSRCNTSITDGKFNTEGNIFAYAVSYDWSKGVEGYQTSQKHHILLHATPEDEIKNRGSRKKR